MQPISPQYNSVFSDESVAPNSLQEAQTIQAVYPAIHLEETNPQPAIPAYLFSNCRCICSKNKLKHSQKTSTALTISQSRGAFQDLAVALPVYGPIEAGDSSSTSSLSESVALFSEMPGHLSQPYNPHTSSEDARVLTERIIALDTQRLAVFHSCGNDRRIQEYVLDILENPIYQRNQPLPWVMVSPLLQPVKYDQIVDGKGRRGGPMHYRCLWGQCGQTIKRKGHALEHIQVHVGNRTFVCSVCGNTFVRKNELQRHQPCRKAFQNPQEVALLELSGCVQPPRGDPFGDPRRSALGAGMFFGGRFH